MGRKGASVSGLQSTGWAARNYQGQLGGVGGWERGSGGGRVLAPGLRQGQRERAQGAQALHGQPEQGVGIEPGTEPSGGSGW